jgi:hypothetical protein
MNSMVVEDVLIGVHAKIVIGDEPTSPSQNEKAKKGRQNTKV